MNGAWVGLFLAACAAGVPPTLSLRLGGAPADARVTIDDIPLGSFEIVARRGVALPPGPHRITIERQGYFPWDKEVVAAGKEPIRLQVEMIPIPE